MKKYIIPVLIALVAFSSTSNAQVRVLVGPGFGYGPGYGYPPPYPRPYHRRQPQQQQNLPPFQPSVNLSLGYGFPNLDKYQLPNYYNLYQGNVSQQLGPITGAVDYQFTRTMSLGVMVTHGTVNVPYYYYNSESPAFTAALNNWSVMLDLVHYMPINYYDDRVLPYIRLAAGVNIWSQDSTTNANVGGYNLPDFAYQISIGAKFKLSQNAGLFLEAGYGKYILEGGLAFKF
jgi:hypothetical protein